MGQLIDWFPQPTPIRLAGRVVLASQFRIQDLAYLTAWFRGVTGGDPLAPLEEMKPGTPGYRDELRRLYDAAANPEESGLLDPRLSQLLFSTPLGLQVVIAKSVAPNHDNLIADDISDMVDEMAKCDDIVIQVARLKRIALAIRDFSIVSNLIDIEIGATWDEPSRPFSWDSRIMRLLKRMSLKAIGELYLGQFEALLAEGSPAPIEPVPNNIDDEDRVLSLREAFWAEGASP